MKIVTFNGVYMDVSAAIQWIYNRPEEERQEFVVETFGVSKEYAIELLLTLQFFEKILIKNMEPVCD